MVGKGQELRPMPIIDDIKRIDVALSDQREDMQAVSRQLGQVEKDVALLNASLRTATEDRTAMRIEVNRINSRFDDLDKRFSEHIRSIEAFTNQWKGATTAGNMIARALFRAVGALAAVGIALWTAWDQLKHIWQWFFR